MKKFFYSLLKLKFFRGKRNGNQIPPEQPPVFQKETALQSPEKSLTSQIQKAREENQAKELRVELIPIEEAKKKETLPPEVISSEVNLLNLPFFALSTKGLENTAKIECRSTI